MERNLKLGSALMLAVAAGCPAVEPDPLDPGSEWEAADLARVAPITMAHRVDGWFDLRLAGGYWGRLVCPDQEDQAIVLTIADGPGPGQYLGRGAVEVGPLETLRFVAAVTVANRRIGANIPLVIDAARCSMDGGSSECPVFHRAAYDLTGHKLFGDVFLPGRDGATEECAVELSHLQR